MEDDNSGIVLQLIKSRNSAELDKYRILKVRSLICDLKNDLADLEYFFAYLKGKCYLPGAGSYHYTDIKDNRTFDIYQKYGFTACNLFKEDVTPEQWDYLFKINYIDEEEYENGRA